MKGYKNIAAVLFAASMYATPILAQDSSLQRGSLGIGFGALAYSGRFAVDKSFSTYSSLYLSVAYRKNVWDELFIRAEILGGRMKGDNTDLTPNPNKTQGWFQTDVVEASVKAEYDFLYLNPGDLTPFVTVGIAGYTLLNYSSYVGDKKNKKTGFALPAGIGVKYKVSQSVTILAEGNARLFTGNLDNHTGSNVSNPNLYYSFGLGISYTFIPSHKKELQQKAP